MSIILGIDPGAQTGVATYIDGRLHGLRTIEPHQLEHMLKDAMPDGVVFEDSRLQSFNWSTVKNRAQALKIARNIGEIDAYCRLIVAICDDLKIPALGVSPKDKGQKLDRKTFQIVTDWRGKSNQHERDAAMVAWTCRAWRVKEAQPCT